MIVGATLLMVRNGTGTPAIAASSVKISESIGGRSWPPYSLGQVRVSHPSLPICSTVSRYALPRPDLALRRSSAPRDAPGSSAW